VYLLLLAIAWAVVLVPPVIQRLLVSRPTTGRDPLAALARRHQSLAPAARRIQPVALVADPEEPDPYVPTSAVEAQQRRRLVGLGLGVLALLTLLLVPVFGPIVVPVNLAVDATLVGFGYAWWRRNESLDAATASVVALSSLRPAAARRATAVIADDLPRVVNG